MENTNTHEHKYGREEGDPTVVIGQRCDHQQAGRKCTK